MSKIPYDYSITNDFPNQAVSLANLGKEIHADETITIGLHHTEINGDICTTVFKDNLPPDQTAALDIIVSNHDGISPVKPEPPTMPDGRPIVRADTRPLNAQTTFIMAGDSTAIGTGDPFVWDFSNDENEHTGDDVPDGFKCKEILAAFICPVYTKDGCLYFENAPWGSYMTMDVCAPPGTYYPNPAGTIPASALGLDGDDMYAHTGTEYVPVTRFLLKHRMLGTCNMGDELNAEGSSVSPIPPGWVIRGRIYAPEGSTNFRGFASLEIHRTLTVFLPGMSKEWIEANMDSME